MTPTRGLLPSQMDQPMVEGKWSFKQVCAHICFWNTLVVRSLEDLLHARPVDWEPYKNYADVNAKAVSERDSWPVKRVLSEMRVTHSAAMESLRRVPEDKLYTDGKLPGWLTGATLDHYAEHTPQVEAWAARVRPPELHVKD